MKSQVNPPLMRHEEIATVLREEVLSSHSPGERLPPDTVNAERFGVSVVTLREAMRLLVKEGLLTRRRGSGTYVKDRLTQVQGRVAVVFSEDQNSNGPSPWWRLLLNALQKHLRLAGFVPHIHFEVEGELDTDAILRETPDSPLVGILIGHISHNCKGLERLSRHGVPIVSCQKKIGSFYVSNDHEGLIREAVRYLVGKGRRRFALITKQKLESQHDGVDDWMEESFVAAVTQHNILYRPEWVCGISHEQGPGVAFEAIQRMWKQNEDRPDGLLITDDTVFAEIAMALLEMDVEVPDELLVVTHANLGAEMFCPFPTVRFAFDPERMAAVMVKNLQITTDGQCPMPSMAVLPFKLIEAENKL